MECKWTKEWEHTIFNKGSVSGQKQSGKISSLNKMSYRYTCERTTKRHAVLILRYKTLINTVITNLAKSFQQYYVSCARACACVGAHAHVSYCGLEDWGRVNSGYSILRIVVFWWNVGTVCQCGSIADPLRCIFSNCCV